MKRSCYLDTNLLIYFQNSQSNYHEQAVATLDKLVQAQYQIFISSLVLDEYIYNTLKLLVGTREEKLANLKSSLKQIFKLPKFNLVNPPSEPKKHLRIFVIIAKFNLQPRDAYHIFTILENKIKYFATFDSDFDKVFNTSKIKKFNIDIIQKI